MIAVKRSAAPPRPIVLCVDDDPAVLASLRRLLRNESCTLLTAQTPQRALELMDEADVSILIADQRMPGMYGSELLKEAQLRSPRTTRVLLTGYAGTSMVTGPLLEGIEILVAKPWEDRSLRRMIREMLEGREREASRREKSLGKRSSA